HATDLSAFKLSKATAELQDQGLLRHSKPGSVVATADTDVAAAAEEMLRRQKRHHEGLLLGLERMRAYAELRDCRRRYLLDHLGPTIDPCGHCDNCEAGLPRENVSPARPCPLRTRVVHSKLGKGVVLEYSGDHMTVLFDDAGEKTLDLKFAMEHDMLVPA